MAYSIYQTDCIILGIREIQEHDLMFRAFSPVFGYIRVIAKGTRKATSKLRANLQEYAIAEIAVVKGKEFFILTDTRSIFSFVQSKSVVSFLKHTEGLFFDDENDHGSSVNVDVYQMILIICKLIIWIVSEMPDSKETEIHLVEKFFMVYVRGLQGFVEKIDTKDLDMESSLMLAWIQGKRSYIESLEEKMYTL